MNEMHDVTLLHSTKSLDLVVSVRNLLGDLTWSFHLVFLSGLHPHQVPLFKLISETLWKSSRGFSTFSSILKRPSSIPVSFPLPPLTRSDSGLTVKIFSSYHLAALGGTGNTLHD